MLEQSGMVSVNIGRKPSDDKISLKDEEIKDKILHRLKAVGYIGTDSIRITDIEDAEGLNISFDVHNNVEYKRNGGFTWLEGVLELKDMITMTGDICNDIGIYVDECEIEDYTLESEEQIWERIRKKDEAERKL